MDFDAIKSRISAMAQSGVAKAKDLGEIAKLKMSNAAEDFQTAVESNKRGSVEIWPRIAK